MKRPVIFASIVVAALLFLLFLIPRPTRDRRAQPAPEAAPVAGSEPLIFAIFRGLAAPRSSGAPTPSCPQPPHPSSGVVPFSFRNKPPQQPRCTPNLGTHRLHMVLSPPRIPPSFLISFVGFCRMSLPRLPYIPWFLSPANSHGSVRSVCSCRNSGFVQIGVIRGPSTHRLTNSLIRTSLLAALAPSFFVTFVCFCRISAPVFGPLPVRTAARVSQAPQYKGLSLISFSCRTRVFSPHAAFLSLPRLPYIPWFLSPADSHGSVRSVCSCRNPDSCRLVLFVGQPQSCNLVTTVKAISFSSKGGPTKIF